MNFRQIVQVLHRQWKKKPTANCLVPHNKKLTLGISQLRQGRVELTIILGNSLGRIVKLL